MVTGKRQKVKAASRRSWDWVRQNSFHALPFYKRSWNILRQDWLVFLWKFIADFVARSFGLALAFFVITLFTVDYQLFVSLGQPPLAWIDRISDVLRSPAFLAGLVGVAFFATLLATALQSFVVGGIWGVLATGLRGDAIARGRTFFATGLSKFPEVYSLFLVKLAVRAVTTLLVVSLLISAFYAATSGGLEYWATWQKVLLATATLSFLISWIALTRLVLNVIGAPLIIDGLPLGEAILHGAAFVVENFWAMYRLFIFALALMLIPLGLYWVIIMFSNLSLVWPILATPATLFTVFGELFLWVSVSFLGVLFHGAVFAFYRRDDDAFAAENKKDGEGGKIIRESNRPDEGGEVVKNRASSLFRRGVTLEEFLPREAPYRFSIHDVIGGSNSAQASEKKQENGPDERSEEDPEIDEGEDI